MLAIASKVRTNTLPHAFSWIIGFMCLAYLAIQVYYISYAALSMDDFWLSYHTYHYKKAIPYRDFMPYKTVLGYYIFLIPLTLFHGLLSPLIFTKYSLAIVNAMFIFGISTWLKKFYSQKAVLTSLSLIIFTQTFLSYSTDIRVDLFAYWLCFISVLFLFEENYFLAGISIGLGFIICQKAVWYIIAINCGLIGTWFFDACPWKTIKNIAVYNLAAFIILLIYIIFWAHFSTFYTVLQSIFYEPYLLTSFDTYEKINFWSVILSLNPGTILLWPFALLSLLILPTKRHLFIIIYSLIIFFFMVSCKQPFIYFLLAAVPALFLLYTAFFSTLFVRRPFFSLINFHKKLILIFSLLYISGLLFLYRKFTFPSIYLTAGIIPILLCASLSEKLNIYLKPIYFPAVFYLFFLLGIIFPLVNFFNTFSYLDGRYQKSMINLMNGLLNDGSTYIAGVPLLHHVEQPIPGLIHLAKPTIEYLYHPSKKLYPLMTLRSLYFDPSTSEEIIEAIKKAPVKLYVDNNRFHFLPPQIHRYLDSQFQHFWGSIYLYAPEIATGPQTIQIKFTGSYKVISPKNAIIYLANKKIIPDSTIFLTQQHYKSDANYPYRLQLIPQIGENMLLPEFKKNQWEILLSWE